MGKINIRSFAAGILLTVLVMSMIGAAQVNRTITVVYRDIKIIMDGEPLAPKDATGQIIEPFISRGTTYLPLRAVAEAIGYDVEWDEDTSTVILDKKFPAFLEADKRPPVLMYHSISDDAFQLTAANFEAQIKYMSDNGFSFLFPEDIVNSDKYFRPVILTFDDGFRDNYSTAFPILQEYNARATIFMITDFIGEEDYLTAEQIKEMEASGLVRVESHSHNHTDMAEQSEAHVRRQIESSNAALKEITGRNHKVIAYPFGSVNGELKKIAAEYYNVGFATSQGHSRDLLSLFRHGIYNSSMDNDMELFLKFIYGD